MNTDHLGGSQPYGIQIAGFETVWKKTPKASPAPANP